MITLIMCIPGVGLREQDLQRAEHGYDEIKITAVRITEKYTLRFASEKTHDDMVLMDHFIGFAKGHSCPLIFERCKG